MYSEVAKIIAKQYPDILRFVISVQETSSDVTVLYSTYSIGRVELLILDRELSDVSIECSSTPNVTSPRSDSARNHFRCEIVIQKDNDIVDKLKILSLSNL